MVWGTCSNDQPNLSKLQRRYSDAKLYRRGITLSELSQTDRLVRQINTETDTSVVVANVTGVQTIMATCKIEMCGHSVKRSSDSKMLGWSWNIYGICVCCANELILLGTHLDRVVGLSSNGCNRQIALEIQYPNKSKMVRNRLG